MVIPLVVVPSLYMPYVVGKSLFLRAILIAVGALWVVGKLTQRTRTPTTSMALTVLSVAVFSWLLWFVLGCTWATDTTRAVWSSLERTEGALGLVVLFVVASLLTKSLGSCRGRWLELAAASLAVSGVVALLAASTDSGRWQGTLGSPTFLALYALVHGTGAAALAGAARASTRLRLFAGFIALANAWALWNCASRAALFGAGVAAFTAFWLSTGAKEGRRRSGVIGVSSIFGVGAWLLRNAEWARDSTVLWRILGPQFLGDRAAFYDAAARAIAARPVFGWGPEGIDTALAMHRSAELGAGQWPDRSHCLWLDIAISGGIPALVLTVVIGATAVIAAMSTSRPLSERRGLVAILMGWGVTVSFSFPDLTGWLMLMAVLSYLMATTVPARSALYTTQQRPWPFILGVSSALVLLTADTLSLGAAASHLARAVGPTTNPEQVSEAVSSAISWHPAVRAEAALVWFAHTNANQNTRTNQDLNGELLRFLIAEHSRRPDHVRLSLALAGSQASHGQTTSAIRTLETSRRHCNTCPELLSHQLPLLLQAGQLTQAQRVADEWLALRGDDDARVAVAALSLLSGEPERAQDTLADRATQRPSILLDPWLAEAAMKTGNQEWLARWWSTFSPEDHPAFHTKLNALLAPGNPANTP